MMDNFSFANPVKILFGKGMISKINEEIPQNSKVLVTYGGGSIKKNGVYNQVKEALKGFEWYEFGGIEANPHFETCMEAVKIVKEKGITFLLSVGGGSVLDGTKLISVASFVDYDPWKIMVEHKEVKKALPIGAIITLPATGSEMNGNSVITKAATKEKRDFFSLLVYPKFSVLDPETTFSMPARQIGNGVIDTFVHVMEQYLTYPVGAKIPDYFAESIIRILVEDGPQALKEPRNYDVRANLMWAATWALNGWISKGVPEDWASHMIGHEITALYGLDHGQTLAIVLPGVMEIMRKEKGDKIMQLGSNVFNINEGSNEEKITKTIEAVDQFFRSMGAGTRFADYNLAPSAIDPIVKRFEERDWMLGEHQNITAPVIRKILSNRL